MSSNGKLWGGRFSGSTHQAVEDFTRSLDIDSRLWSADLRGSIAHARMLGKTGVLPNEESQKIIIALEEISKEHSAAPIHLHSGAEDVHSVIEQLLASKLGPLSGKLHTARSRNDQVSTATRLHLRDELDGLTSELSDLQKTLLALSENHLETLLPGMTHLQHAQPVSFAHHLMAYFWMLQRDRERVSDARKRVNHLPLGSAALAGTSFPIDRTQTAKELNFESICENSLDAVSDRDYVVESLSACALILTHLSRLSEELILWSTPEFNFVELDDSVTTGSSIMPQKKNPDVAELIRGRAARGIAAWTGAITLIKGLPLSYNRDLQEDKRFLFEGVDTARACVRLAGLMLETAQFNAEKMKASLAGDFSNATDLADYLAQQGMPFRQAHEVVGQIVRHCLDQKQALESLDLAVLQKFSKLFNADILPKLQHLAVMKARTSRGGTAPEAVKKQMELARKFLS